MYHCTNCRPEAEILQLILPFHLGSRMSFHPFGASEAVTLSTLYAMPAGSTPVQKKYPFGWLRLSFLYAPDSGEIESHRHRNGRPDAPPRSCCRAHPSERAHSLFG